MSMRCTVPAEGTYYEVLGQLSRPLSCLVPVPSGSDCRLQYKFVMPVTTPKQSESDRKCFVGEGVC